MTHQIRNSFLSFSRKLSNDFHFETMYLNTLILKNSKSNCLKRNLANDFELLSPSNAQQKIKNALSEKAIVFLESIRKPSSFSFFLIKNLPIDSNLPDNPAQSAHHLSHVSNSIVLGIGSFLGEPYAFSQEKFATLVHDVHPKPEKENEQHNAGSAVSFGLHMELAFHHAYPDYLLLLCMRPDRQQTCKTYIAENKNIISLLNQSDIDILKKPLYKIHTPPGFVDASWQPSLRPMLEEYDGNYCVFLAEHCHIETASSESQSALKKLKNAANLVKEEIPLSKGDLLIINNKKMLHGRSAFHADYGYPLRWLKRVYVKENLWGSEITGLKYPNRIIR